MLASILQGGGHEIPRSCHRVVVGCDVGGTNAQARGPFGSINVGNWKGGAYTNDQTGAFTHCSAGSQPTSGIFFMVMIDKGGGWSLAFAHDKWSLKTGDAFPGGSTGFR